MKASDGTSSAPSLFTSTNTAAPAAAVAENHGAALNTPLPSFSSSSERVVVDTDIASAINKSASPSLSASPNVAATTGATSCADNADDKLLEYTRVLTAPPLLPDRSTTAASRPIDELNTITSTLPS